MKVEKKGDITIIRFISREQIEKTKFRALVLLALPGLFMLLLGNFITLPAGSQNVIIPFFLLCLLLSALSVAYNKRIEIHPEYIYIKDHPLKKERRFPVKKNKTVLMLDSFPFVDTIIPREKWRLLMGYDDGIFCFLEDINDYNTIRRTASILSDIFHLPVVDYTYSSQHDIVMFLEPGELNLPFIRRAVRFPELIIVGEIPEGHTIYEEIITPTEWKYNWTAFTARNIITAAATGGLASLLVWRGIIGSESYSIFYLPEVFEKPFLYNIIFIAVLGFFAYYSSLRKDLFLRINELKYQCVIMGRAISTISIPPHKILEIRVKPSPAGFALMIISTDKILTLRTHHGGIKDFVSLLWLSERIQDFLLTNRQILEKALKNKNTN